MGGAKYRDLPIGIKHLSQLTAMINFHIRQKAIVTEKIILLTYSLLLKVLQCLSKSQIIQKEKNMQYIFTNNRINII